MQLTKQQRGCDPKVIKWFLKNFQKTFLKEMFQIKQHFGKNDKKYREEGTKRMQSKLILGRGLFN